MINSQRYMVLNPKDGCSDNFDFDHKIMCAAYDELDENLAFSDWHNF